MGGYDIGLSLASSPSASSSISAPVDVKGGGVSYLFAGKGSTVTPSSPTKTLLIILGVVLGLGLVSFVLWKVAR